MYRNKKDNKTPVMIFPQVKGCDFMNCPYCGLEMEKGKVQILSAFPFRDNPCLQWYHEKEFYKKGLFASFKRVPKIIKKTKGLYYEGAFNCDKCKKVFGEFPTL